MKNLLNSITELELLLAGIKGENSCIVITKNGAIFTGNIPAEKLGKLQEIPLKIAGKKFDTNLDGNGAQEFINTKWWVNTLPGAFKNSWDNGMLKLPQEPVNPSLIFMWTLLVEISDIEDIKCGEKIITGNNYTFFSVSIGEVTAFYNSYFTLQYITVKGDITEGKPTEYWV
jgi:hypothetical protein